MIQIYCRQLAKHWQPTLTQMIPSLCSGAYVILRDEHGELFVPVSCGHCPDNSEMLARLSGDAPYSDQTFKSSEAPAFIGRTQVFPIPGSKRRTPGYLCLNSEQTTLLSLDQYPYLENFLIRIRHNLENALNQTQENTLDRGIIPPPKISLQNFIDSLDSHIWIKNPNGHYMVANRKVIDDWSINPIGKTDKDLFEPEVARQFQDADKRALEQGKMIITDACHIENGNKEKWVETIKYPVMSNDGQVAGILGMTRDISQRKALQEQIRLSTAAFENAFDAFILTDPQGNIVNTNKAFTDITGYSREEVIGSNPRFLKSGRHNKAFYLALWEKLVSDGRWQGELWNRRKDGSIYPQLSSINAIYDDNNRVCYYMAVFIEITKQKETEAQLAKLAYLDSLTGLYNRTAILSKLERALQDSTQGNEVGAVLFIDIDHFKLINDTRGHAIGDEVLIEVAERLNDTIRTEDFAARLGGDEFLVLLSGTQNQATITDIVARIMLSLSRTVILTNGDQLKVTTSIGVAQFPKDGKEATLLLSAADTAMFSSKRSGRNSFSFYNRAMREQSQRESRLRDALLQGLIEEQFYLVYQPKVNLPTGKLIGVEALLRWHHPEMGTVSPSEFIPIAEQGGVIEELGAWVLETACTQGKAWLDDGFQFGRIAVNVSIRQIAHALFIDTVNRALSITGFPASSLEIEITETCLIRNFDISVVPLNQLRKMGIKVSLDDFGTGYSSLSYLSNLPINTLKIDRSFIQHLPETTKSRLIAEAIISLGNSFEMDVLAEGVETTEQADFLTTIGCNQAQGFLYGKPMSPDDLKHQFEAVIAPR